jgi:hypothetical protein
LTQQTKKLLVQLVSSPSLVAQGVTFFHYVYWGGYHFIPVVLVVSGPSVFPIIWEFQLIRSILVLPVIPQVLQ